MLVAGRGEETARAFENGARSGEAQPRQVGGQHAIHGGLARVQRLAHRAAGVEFPQPGCLSAGASQRVEHLRGVQPDQVTGGDRRAESGDRAGRVPVAVVAGVDRLADAQRRLITQHHGAQEVTATTVFTLGHGQGGRDDRGCRVNGRGLVDVVEFQRVGRHAIGQRRPRRTGAPCGEDGGLVGGAQATDHTLDHAGLRFEGPGQHRTEAVQHAAPGVFGHGLRKSRRGGHEVGEGGTDPGMAAGVGSHDALLEG